MDGYEEKNPTLCGPERAALFTIHSSTVPVRLDWLVMLVLAARVMRFSAPSTAFRSIMSTWRNGEISVAFRIFGQLGTCPWRQAYWDPLGCLHLKSLFIGIKGGGGRGRRKRNNLPKLRAFDLSSQVTLVTVAIRL